MLQPIPELTKLNFMPAIDFKWDVHKGISKRKFDHETFNTEPAAEVVETRTKLSTGSIPVDATAQPSETLLTYNPSVLKENEQYEFLQDNRFASWDV
ncbi:hypothetical protein H0H93_006193, partial [Arthromyces matolae]